MQKLFVSLLFAALTSGSVCASLQERASQEFEVAPGENLVVDVAFGTVEVESGSKNVVSIEAYRKLETSDPAMEKAYAAAVPIVISKEGNTVFVRARRTDERSWNWSGNTNLDARYQVRVPKKFNLDLKSGGGSISASNVAGDIKVSTGGGTLKLAQLKGPVDARTSGGSIRLEDCDGALVVKTSGGEIRAHDGGGSLDARTSGGSIAVHDFGGDAVVKTSGGQLRFENVRGKMVGQTSGGSITAALVSPLPGEVDLASSAGSISLSVPADAGMNLEARTSVGAVSNDLPIIATRNERDELSGAVNGGGKSVVLRANAGSISIRAAAPEARER